MRRNKQAEQKRRRLELWLLLPLGVLFIFLNWVLFRLYNSGEDLPLSYALFYFGLINLNVLIFLAIVFFLGRNLVKIYADSKYKRFGRSLKSRLFVAFVSFAFIPTCLMFLVSVFYINNSFDRWFANKRENILKNSSQLTNQYVSDIKSNAFYVANQLVKQLPDKKIDQAFLDQKVSDYGVDAVEFYGEASKLYLISVFSEKSGFYIPKIEDSEVLKAIQNKKTKSITRKTEQGDWVSAIVYAPELKGLVVVSKVLPFTLVGTINSILSSRVDFQKTKDFKIPLKSSYLFILVTMTLVILAFGGWFSLYLSESLSKSLYMLGLATKRISKGDFNPIRMDTGMDEVNGLIENFNLMTYELNTAQEDLNESVKSLERHSIYMDTVLSQVTSGVISCDNDFKLSLINKRIEKLFDVKLEKVKGQIFKDVFPAELYQFLENFKKTKDEVAVEEMDIVLTSGSEIPVQMSVAKLFDQRYMQMGYIIALEKVDLLRENQRVKAWKEVATRVAHEIKNPLTPVKLSAERLQKKFSDKVDDPAFSQSIKTILYHVDLIRDLVNEFNQYARFPMLKPEKVDFYNFVTELVETYKSSHPKLKFDIGISNMGLVVFDKDQMRRVFINLIENSIEAMKGLPKQEIYIDASYSQSGHVILIKFYDSGPGVPKESWQNVFKSRYTTKSSNSGLGLSIVKKIVDDHGGRISILKGSLSPSVFLIELPFRKL